MVVAVVDPAPGRGASWAAAGMLAPVSEVHYGEEALLELNLASARQWPAFAAELAGAVGHGVGYRPCGTLVVAVDDGDRAWAEELVRYPARARPRRDVAHRGARPASSSRASPRACAGRSGGGRPPGGQPRAGDALIEAVAGAGVDVRRIAAAAVELAGGAVHGVALGDGEVLDAPVVVLAAGCWSGTVGGLPDGVVPRRARSRARSCAFRRPGRPELGRTVRAMVHGASVYVVPRADGSVVVGATVEEQGYDTSVSAGAVYELLRDAYRVVPGVTEMVLDEASAGLRPGSPDNAPLIGPVAVPGAGGWCSPRATTATASCSPRSPPTRWPPWCPEGSRRPPRRRSGRPAWPRRRRAPAPERRCHAGHRARRAGRRCPSVNGEPGPVAPGATVAELVALWCPSPRGIAVACNGQVVPRSSWATTRLSCQDRVEIVTATAGG